MADWGLYSALRGTDDWQAKRSDALMNLQAAEKRRALAQDQEIEAIKSEEYIAKYTEAMQNLDVLNEDKSRVAAAEKQARQEIVNGIAKHHGDVRAFMASGGVTALNNYKTSVLNSEENLNAISNKQNQASWLQDRSKNMYIHKVDVDVPVFDEKGNQTGTQKKKMSMEEQMALFQEGKISTLNYKGGEKKIDINPWDFKKNIKDMNDPRNPNNHVSQSDIVNVMLQKGGSKEQAYDAAQKYRELLENGGDSWKFGAADTEAVEMKADSFNAMADRYNMSMEDKRLMYEKQLELNRMKLDMQYKAGLAAAKAKAEKDKVANLFGTKMKTLTNAGDNTGLYMNDVERDVWERELNITPFSQALAPGFGTGQKYTGQAVIMGASGDRNNYKWDPESKKGLNLANAEIISFGGRNGYTQIGGKKYLVANMAIPYSQFVDAGVNFDPGSPYRNIGGQNSQPSNNINLSDEYQTSMVLLPIDEAMKGGHLQAIMNKEYNIKTNSMEAMPASQDYDDMNMEAYNSVLSILQSQGISSENVTQDQLQSAYDFILQAGGNMQGRSYSETE
jgi:hypothetical protein